VKSLIITVFTWTVLSRFCKEIMEPWFSQINPRNNSTQQATDYNWQRWIYHM